MIRLLLTAVAAIALYFAFGETKEAEAQYGQPGWGSGSGQLMITGLDNGKRRKRRRGGSQPIIISGGLNGAGSNGGSSCPQTSSSFTGNDKFSEYLRFVIYHQMIHDRQDEMSSMEQTRQIEELIRQRVSDAAKQHLIERLMAKAQTEESNDQSLQNDLMEQLQQARSDANAKAVLQAIIAAKRNGGAVAQPMQPQIMLLPAEPQQAQVTYRAKYLRVQPRRLVPLRRVH